MSDYIDFENLVEDDFIIDVKEGICVDIEVVINFKIDVKEVKFVDIEVISLLK